MDNPDPENLKTYIIDDDSDSVLLLQHYVLLELNWWKWYCIYHNFNQIMVVGFLNKFVDYVLNKAIKLLYLVEIKFYYIYSLKLPPFICDKYQLIKFINSQYSIQIIQYCRF